MCGQDCLPSTKTGSRLRFCISSGMLFQTCTSSGASPLMSFSAFSTSLRIAATCKNEYGILLQPPPSLAFGLRKRVCKEWFFESLPFCETGKTGGQDGVHGGGPVGRKEQVDGVGCAIKFGAEPTISVQYF